MMKIRCVFVEKKKGFDVEAQSLLNDFKSNLRMDNLQEVRVINKYILGAVSEEHYKKALNTIFSELTVDRVYRVPTRSIRSKSRFSISVFSIIN